MGAPKVRQKSLGCGKEPLGFCWHFLPTVWTLIRLLEPCLQTTGTKDVVAIGQAQSVFDRALGRFDAVVAVAYRTD